MIRELCYDCWGMILEYVDENTIYSILLTFKDTINNVWCIKVNNLGYSYDIKRGKLHNVVINLGYPTTFIKTKRLIKYSDEILLNFDHYIIDFKDGILMRTTDILNIFENYAYKITLNSNVFTYIDYQPYLYELYKILCRYKFAKDNINYVENPKFVECYSILELNNTIKVDNIFYVIDILIGKNNFKHIIYEYDLNTIIMHAKEYLHINIEENLNKFSIIKEENKTIFHRK